MPLFFEKEPLFVSPALFGFLPNRKGNREQSGHTQSRTSFACPQQQSRHFARIACKGVIPVVPLQVVFQPLGGAAVCVGLLLGDMLGQLLRRGITHAHTLGGILDRLGPLLLRGPAQTL